MFAGVCPIAEFSQTLMIGVGRAHAACFYMTNQTLSAVQALQLGLTDAVCRGVSLAQQCAQNVTAALVSIDILSERVPADTMILAREAMGHAECRNLNCGEATAAIDSPAHLEPIKLEAVLCYGRLGRLVQRSSLVLTTANMSLLWSLTWFPCDGAELDGAPLDQRMAKHPTIALRWQDACTSSTLPTWPFEFVSGAVELHAKRQRLSCCLHADMLPVCKAKMEGADAISATSFSFHGATGVAVLELEATCMAPTLEAALSRFRRLGPALRAVALNIVGGDNLATSVLTFERVGEALGALHTLGVPIVCSVDGHVQGVGKSVWSAADYCTAGERTNLHAVRHGATSKRTACPREHATDFAAWLAHHSAIGLRHMLCLMRPRLRDERTTDEVGRATLLYGAGTRSETRLPVAWRKAQMEALASPDPVPASSRPLATLVTLSVSRPVTAGQLSAPPEHAAAPCAFELYMPHRCASAAAIDVHQGCSGSQLHAPLVGNATPHATRSRTRRRSMALTTITGRPRPAMTGGV